jgi:hypothetical protein
LSLKHYFSAEHANLLFQVKIVGEALLALRPTAVKQIVYAMSGGPKEKRGA